MPLVSNKTLLICSKFVDAFVDSFLSQQNDLGFSIDSEEAVKKRLAMHLIIIIIFIISIFYRRWPIQLSWFSRGRLFTK